MPATGTRFAAAALAAALAALLGASCAREAPVLAAFDEAFAAARPDLVQAFVRRKSGPGGSGLLVLTFGDGPGKALMEVDRLTKAGSPPAALVASPLLASALAPSGLPSPALGTVPLVGVEVGGALASRIATVRGDPGPAYRAAGRAAGSYIAALRAEGGEAACGVVFMESPSRPRSALEAFLEAFREASGGASAIVKTLAGEAADRPGLEARASTAETAVRELLGSDLRILFVSAGPLSAAALAAAARPGLVLGADLPAGEPLPGLGFRVSPDEEGIATEALRLAREAGAPREDPASPGPAGASVPALLEPGSGPQPKAGGRGFEAYLAAAAPGRRHRRPGGAPFRWGRAGRKRSSAFMESLI